MSYLEELNVKVKERTAKVAVIGLGYVGLPVACVLASEGFHVVGVDIKDDRVDQINRKICPIEGEEPGLQDLLEKVIEDNKFTATVDYQKLRDVDICLIDVETPIDKNHIPQYRALRSACESLGEVMRDGTLVIVESTIAPGTIDQVVRPLLEKVSGKKSKQDFFLGACPERVMPGKLLANLHSMSRVCGGETPQVAQVMAAFYRNIVDADLDEADVVTAEVTKTAENAYRDVNIAFANELALICQSVGADFIEVRKLVNKSPGRNVLFAGGGVGGHCIPKDPWLLAYGTKGQVDLRLIPAARSVNDLMPLKIADMTTQALQEANVSVEDAKVAILGYAYLEESDDIRNSPSQILVSVLKERGMDVVVHDPYVKEFQSNVYELIRDCNAIIIMVAHQAYKDLDLTLIKKRLANPFLIDARRVINPSAAENAGFRYYGIGLGASRGGVEVKEKRV
ncbi:MAG: nucleotide sugar dehydrogenase [Chloroflexota bacterium]|nr:nucleotide sugar dehydrogenase [Chloroflexota bacterium]